MIPSILRVQRTPQEDHTPVGQANAPFVGYRKPENQFAHSSVTFQIHTIILDFAAGFTRQSSTLRASISTIRRSEGSESSTLRYAAIDSETALLKSSTEPDSVVVRSSGVENQSVYMCITGVTELIRRRVSLSPLFQPSYSIAIVHLCVELD
jgi:hypothetical protein